MTVSDPTLARNLRIAVIGAGALGCALARRLRERGFSIRAIVSRKLASAEALAKHVEAPVASAHVQDLPADVTFVFCCVPDAAIPSVARALAELPRSWEGVTVAHTSGVRTSDALSPLGVQGATLLSFHPLQTFPPDSPADVFDGIYTGLEGDPEAVALGTRLAEALGTTPVAIPTEAKARYHLAGSIASNFAVTLAALAGEVLATIGIPYEQGRAMLMPLVQATLHNLAHKTPEESLTGPIVRGDLETVARHLHALRAHLPHLVPIYSALAAETVRVAARSGRLSDERTAAMRQLLHLPTPEDDLRR